MKIFFVIALLVLGTSNAISSTIPWSEEDYSRYSQKENVSDVLLDLASGSGFSVSISEKVDGIVNGTFENYTYEQVYNALAKMFGLISYFDGSILWVYRIDEIDSTTIVLKSLSVHALKEKLSELGLYDPNRSWRALERERIIYLVGPERYLDIVTQIANDLDNEIIENPIPLFAQVDDDGVIHFSDQPSNNKVTEFTQFMSEYQDNDEHSRFEAID